MAQSTPTSFAALLESALTDPGTISSAYSAFHNYSFGNQLLAMSQCLAREIPLGPIATFPKWLELGRCVRKGEKAIVLCQPVTIKAKDTPEGEDPAVFTRFTYRPKWFVLAQTDGDDMPAVTVPTWDKAAALTALDITEKPFDLTNGNVGGYAQKRTIAINPVGTHPFRTLLHELAHIVLGHTSEGDQLSDDPTTPRTIREVEAESVAYLCAAALGYTDGAEDARGYIQTWHARGEAITDKHAQRIFKATDQILKAGRTEDADAIATEVDRAITTEGGR